jgi:hypothetical protein
MQDHLAQQEPPHGREWQNPKNERDSKNNELKLRGSGWSFGPAGTSFFSPLGIRHMQQIVALGETGCGMDDRRHFATMADFDIRKCQTLTSYLSSLFPIPLRRYRGFLT